MFKKEKIKDLHYSVVGFLASDDVRAAADEILLSRGKKMKIAGFRPGRVPLNILRQRYGAGAWADAMDKLMNRDVSDFTAAKKIKLAGSPRADIQKCDVGADVEYTLEFDILPTLPDIDLGQITLTRKVAKVEKDEIEKSLHNLRKSRAQAEKQGPDYRAANGDTALIDFKGFIGDDAFPGGEAKRHHLIIGSGSFIPGFEEKLIGHKAGDKFDIKVKFPKDYHAADLAGKEARFEIEIHELRHHILPELNDDLAKAVGMSDVAALRAHIDKVLSDQYAEASRKEMQIELLGILADKVKLDLPETLVAQELEVAKNELDHADGGATAADKKWDEKKEHKEAQRRVKLGLILAEWGGANGIKIENSDLQQAIWAEAAGCPNPREVFDFYNKNPNALAMIRGMLFEQKTLDAMIAKTKTKEKTVKPEELFKQAEVR